MADFLAALVEADAAISDHLCSPGVLRPGRPDEVAGVPLAIDRPSSVATPFPGQAGVVLSRPVAWLPLAFIVGSATVSVAVSKNDELVGEGRRWRIAAAPTRPGDGRWWRAEVEDQGAAS